MHPKLFLRTLYAYCIQSKKFTYINATLTSLNFDKNGKKLDSIIFNTKKNQYIMSLKDKSITFAPGGWSYQLNALFLSKNIVLPELLHFKFFTTIHNSSMIIKYHNKYNKFSTSAQVLFMDDCEIYRRSKVNTFYLMRENIIQPKVTPSTHNIKCDDATTSKLKFLKRFFCEATDTGIFLSFFFAQFDWNLAGFQWKFGWNLSIDLIEIEIM